MGMHPNIHDFRTLTSLDTVLILFERSCCTGIDWRALRNILNVRSVNLLDSALRREQMLAGIYFRFVGICVRELHKFVQSRGFLDNSRFLTIFL